MSKRLSVLSAVLLGFALLAGACSSDSDSSSSDSSSSSSSDTAAPATTAAESSGGDYLGDGSLGEVTVSAGDAIQIRSLNAISGDVAFLGVPNENGIRMAVEDYGQCQHRGRQDRRYRTRNRARWPDTRQGCLDLVLLRQREIRPRDTAVFRREPGFRAELRWRRG